MLKTNQKRNQYQRRNKMKIVEKLRICAPKESVPDSSTLLTFFDVIFIDFKPMQPCYFFSHPHSTSQFLESHLPNIKRSLSLTLQHFYPLAGKLRLSPISDHEQYEIHYKDGDSVQLLIAESEDKFADISGIEPHDTSKLQPLVPDQSMDDLLAIQLTVFPNHGICIGFGIHHWACDGFSYAHFVKSWASICKSGIGTLPSTLKPSIDDHRTVLLDSFHDLCVLCLNGKQKPGDGELPKPAKTKTATLNTILRIGHEEIEMLKASVQAKAKLLGKPLSHCSAYVVSSSYIWSCHVKLRRYSDDQKICFVFPVNWRRRLEPPAPAMYFGNCALGLFVEMKAGELVEENHGLTLACEAIGNKVKEMESGGIRVGIKDLHKYPAHVRAGNPMFIIGYSNKFGLYSVDFGWGRPVKVEPFDDDREEGFSMADNGDDARGVEMAVVLPKHEMQEFVTIFRTGLTALSRNKP